MTATTAATVPLDHASDAVQWRDQGACRGLDPLLFFPDSDDAAGPAKTVCAGCDVRLRCLEHALARREKEGVWGGCTERDRRRILRQRRRID